MRFHTATLPTPSFSARVLASCGLPKTRLPAVGLISLAIFACRGEPSPNSEADSDTYLVSDCTPQCENRACGPDGCGKLCGVCAENEICQSIPESGALTCAKPGACVPDCTGKTCGPDGCGGTCGDCPAQQSCEPQGRCIPCIPSCTTECGPDGCGSFCGECDLDKLCGPAWECVVHGSPCGELAESGLCSGHMLTFCHNGGLTALNCSDLGLFCSFSTEADGFDCVESPCAPRCSGRICGDDGCQGSCGQCPPGVACTSDGECQTAECTEDRIGRCEENVLVTCTNGQKISVDCTQLSLQCRYDPDGNDGLGAFDCK